MSGRLRTGVCGGLRRGGAAHIATASRADSGVTFLSPRPIRGMCRRVTARRRAHRRPDRRRRPAVGLSVSCPRDRAACSMPVSRGRRRKSRLAAFSNLGSAIIYHGLRAPVCDLYCSRRCNQITSRLLQFCHGLDPTSRPLALRAPPLTMNSSALGAEATGWPQKEAKRKRWP
jgi:hypothetical protein